MSFENPLHILIAHRLTAVLVEYLLERGVEARVGILLARLAHHLAQHMDEPRPATVRYLFISGGKFARAQPESERHRTGIGQRLSILINTGQRRLIEIERSLDVL